MAEPLKFTFNTAFGTRSENQELNVKVPVITQDDVDAARTQGFVQGREDGLTEATSQYNAEFQASFEALASKLDLIVNSQAATAQMAIEQAQNYALLIAQKISKAALTQHPTDQIIALIEDCLSHINLMPHLVIRVNQSLSAQTQAELQPIIEQKGFEGKLIILGEEDIPLGDCMIEWADGGVAHNTQEIVQAINNRLTDYFGYNVEAVPTEVKPDLSPEVDLSPEADLSPENYNLADEKLIENNDPQDEKIEATDFADQAKLSTPTLDETVMNDPAMDDSIIDDTLMAEPNGLEGQTDE
ncbi:MAG: hypothetical protein COB24_12290 [Hyphomicrobiales bacterium]|nr:MAG: hypothetical protein COB24_12290 [Hyphomicrobiales bacterium]